MKYFSKTIFAIFIGCISVFHLQAQLRSDITGIHLTNAGFEQNYNFPVASTFNTITGDKVLDVYGWTKGLTATYTIAGTIELGSEITFNNSNPIPTRGYNNSTGGVLALTTGWDQTLSYYQEVTLSAGKYAIETVYYNAGTTTTGSSVLGWIPDGGTPVMSSEKSYVKGVWTVETVVFTVAADNTKGKIQIGYKAGGNGSANSAKLLYDFVKLYSYVVDKSALNTKLGEAKAIRDDANTSTTAKTYIGTVISNADNIASDANATSEQVMDAIDSLDVAIASCSDASLTDLQIDGVTIGGFNTNTLEYTYYVAPDANPIVTGVPAKAVAGAIAVVTKDANNPNITIVTVTAGKGSPVKTYRITFNINLMAGWDGNGVGTVSDKPGDFGWNCSTPVTWTTAENTNDVYAYRYRDNLGVGRAITHPLNNSVFSYPVMLKAGKVYTLTVSGTNMNGARSTTFGINAAQDGTGQVLGSQTKNAAQWTAFTNYSFSAACPADGTYYVTWQTNSDYERNIAWGFMLTETGNALTASFDTQGGSPTPQFQYIAVGSKIIKPEDPVKPGFVFMGWGYQKVGVELIWNFDVDKVGENKPLTLKAVWKVGCTVTFNSDGGSTVPQQNIITGNTVDIPAAPTKSGFVFDGWYSNGTKWNFNNPISTDLNLKAVWATGYTVTFDADGGSTVPSQIVVANSKLSVPTNPYKEGFVFNGWYYNDVIWDFDATVAENIALKAKWIISSATVTHSNKGDVTVASYSDANIRVEGKTNLFLTSDTPLINSTIDLAGDDAWLYFRAVKPSKVLSQYAQSIKVNGLPFNESRDRVAIYADGAVVIPNGMAHSKAALTVYTGKNFTGESRTFEVNVYNRSLGAFDNKIRSFKLKKGFSASLANNSAGTGFSRYFIASDEDIEMAEMPEGLEFVSFVRVFKWEWTGKKGWAGNPSNQLNVSVFNTWGGGQGTPNIDRQFVPMRHNAGWDSWAVINAQNNVTHLLGFNEPDRPDQSNMTVDAAIAQWPNFFQSGLRLGSPAPASTNAWLARFMNVCDSLNYRVDFMVTHAYQYQNTGWWNWYIDATSRGNRSIEEAGAARPIWITEWNNGANWTSESWPTASGPKRDAKLNIVLDNEGNQTVINRPLSPENSAQSVYKMKELLPHFDKLDLFEHHFFYNWVQDARSMELGGVLTPAGEYFASYKSAVGFKKKNEYIHKWRIAPPWIYAKLSDDYKSFNMEWYDHNGETGTAYIIQLKAGDGEYTDIKALVSGKDYVYGGTVRVSIPIENEKSTYRVYAVSYKNVRSIYSREFIYNREQALDPPILTGNAMSPTIIKLSWNEVTGARSYRLERSLKPDTDFEVIQNLYTDTKYTDESLQPNTDYYYRIYSLNSAAGIQPSSPLKIRTKSKEAPESVTGLRAAGGDAAITLTWDYVYDAVYDVFRSDSEEGTYTKIASGLTVTENNARYKDAGDLSNGQTYFYKIQPYNEYGRGEESVVVNAAPGAGQYLHLTFKEGSGQKVYDVWGGFHADFKSDPTWSTVNGRDGKSAVFLNVANNSYMELPSGVVRTLGKSFTIASWLYLPSGAGNNTRMFDFGKGTDAYMAFIPKYNNAGQARYQIAYSGKTFEPTFSYNFPLGQWAHVAFSMQEDPKGGGLLFTAYLNGEPVATDKDTQSLTPSGMGLTRNNWLGRSQSATDPYCEHGYDDFRIYSKALTNAEITNLYRTGDISGLFTNKMTDLVVSLMPNPVNVGQKITVTVHEINQLSQNFSIYIYGILGDQIGRYEVNEPTSVINAPTIPGTYILKINSKNYTKSVKISVK